MAKLKNNSSNIPELTQEQIDNINNYGGEIETITDYMAVIKLRPGMYIGRIGAAGFINMIREIFQNALDELIKDKSPCTKIWVFFDERTHTVVIRDNGRGIPYGSIIRTYTEASTSSNYHKKEGEFSAGMHGAGAKASCALSSEFFVESFVLGEGRRVEFREGYPWDKKEHPIKNDDNYQGTIVEFRPNYDILTPFELEWKTVYNLIADLTMLSKIGAVVEFEAIDKTGKKFKESIVNSDGIFYFLIKKTANPMIKPIVVQRHTGFMMFDAAFTYDPTDGVEEDVSQFANMCPTSGDSTHIKGAINALTRFFVDYMNKIYLVNNKKITVNSSDIKTGLKGVVTAFHLNAVFTGQAKEILSNLDMENFANAAVTDALREWVKNNNTDLMKLCKFFKDVAEVRLNSDKERIKLSNNYKKSAITGLPSKVKKANGTTNLECIIIEGDSAGGGAGISRDKETQVIFPIKGKLPNAYTTQKDKFLANEEIAGLISLFDCGYGKKFDIVKFKKTWSKVILLPDKDADGGHIRQLAVYFFLLYLPAIIEHGMLYTGMPPLYGYRFKKKMVYFQDRIDYIKFIHGEFSSKNVIKNINGKVYSEKEIVNIIYQAGDFIKSINEICDIFAIDPILLEDVIKYSSLPYDKFVKKIESLYRFIKVRKNDVGTVIIEGLKGDKYQTIVINEKMQNYLAPLIAKSSNYEFEYLLNDTKVSLYQLMEAFEESCPDGITRYKGLGEMNPDQLGESTLRSENRTLLRIRMDNIEESIAIIREVNSNKKLLLDSIGTVTKDDII